MAEKAQKINKDQHKLMSMMRGSASSGSPRSITRSLSQLDQLPSVRFVLCDPALCAALVLPPRAGDRGLGALCRITMTIIAQDAMHDPGECSQWCGTGIFAVDTDIRPQQLHHARLS